MDILSKKKGNIGMKSNGFSRLIEPKFRMVFVVLAVFALLSFTSGQYWLGAIEVVTVTITYILHIRMQKRRKREIIKYMEAVTVKFDATSENVLSDFPLPAAVVNLDSEEVIWCNSHFTGVRGDQTQWFGFKIGSLIEDFSLDWLREKNSEGVITSIGDQIYRVCGSIIPPSSSNNYETLATLFFIDITEQEALAQELELTKPVLAIIQLDNYDELVKSTTSHDQFLLMASIDAKINEWKDTASGIFFKNDRDKYIYIFEERYLNAFVSSKFDILESVKAIKSPGNIPPTISIGIGHGGSTYFDCVTNARLALDMALSRGGDQVVIKNDQSYEFFGGMSREVEKRTKVKSRVMAHAIEDLINTSSRVLVMGHRFSDMDSIGASVGVACACRKLGKPCKIVFDTNASSARILYDKLMESQEYADAFITRDEAMEIVNNDTLLVVVDTNRPDYVEVPELLAMVGKIVVIDHHRRAADYIENSSLNLHEPYASSACELLTEILQYLVAPNDILRVEAECMLAGITLDTKNFTMKTGVRTFEAAAYVRRAGADTIEVKRLFQNDMGSYLARCDIIRTAVRYRNNITIAYSADNVDRPVAAQAADELLNIAGIQASFVIYRNNNTTHISGRSLGQINVQVILERLGGGGSLTGAGAQMGDVPTSDVAEKLKASIDAYYSMI